MVLCSFVQLVSWTELVCIICGFAGTLGRLTVLLFLVGWCMNPYCRILEMIFATTPKGIDGKVYICEA